MDKKEAPVKVKTFETTTNYLQYLMTAMLTGAVQVTVFASAMLFYL